MNRKRPSALRILLSIAAILVAVVFIGMGQLLLAVAVVVAAVIFGVAALFSRAKTPTD
jgi:hypothetical protein